MSFDDGSGLDGKFLDEHPRQESTGRTDLVIVVLIHDNSVAVFHDLDDPPAMDWLPLIHGGIKNCLN